MVSLSQALNEDTRKNYFLLFSGILEGGFWKSDLKIKENQLTLQNVKIGEGIKDQMTINSNGKQQKNNNSKKSRISHQKDIMISNNDVKDTQLISQKIGKSNRNLAIFQLKNQQNFAFIKNKLTVSIHCLKSSLK